MPRGAGVEVGGSDSGQKAGFNVCLLLPSPRAWLPSPSQPGAQGHACSSVNSGDRCCWGQSHLLPYRSHVLFLVQGWCGTRDKTFKSIRALEKSLSP